MKITQKDWERMIQFRRDLHKIPEIGLTLPKTYQYIATVLANEGIVYKSFMDHNAIVCDILGDLPGKNLAIRADMDALKIEEKTGLPYASTNHNMHACGHDAHMAIALTALLIFHRNKENLQGLVRFIFQPGEEYPGGAKPLIEAGVLENPTMDYIIGCHVGGLFPEIPFGKIGVKAGRIMASMDHFEMEITGVGGHGAMPYEAIDPIPCMCDIIQIINRMPSREIDANKSSVISVCHAHSGSSQNIIPEKAYIEGTVRTFEDSLRRQINDRLEQISEYTAKANRCQIKFEYDWKYPVVKNDPEATEILRQSVRDVLQEKDLFDIQEAGMIAEDMGFYLQKIPGVFFMLSNLQPDETGRSFTNHHERFRIDERVLYKVVLLYLDFQEKIQQK